MKIKSPLTVYERGVVQFNDERQQFGHRATFPKDAPLYPHGHPFLHRAADGQEYVYFAGGMPLVRVRASLASYLDPSQYETYTFLPGRLGERCAAKSRRQFKIRMAWRSAQAGSQAGEQTDRRKENPAPASPPST